ncbi:MAG: nucleotide triphosphate diphosphatase NUDT15 [Solirubrobacteraceae bacterium]
MTSPATVTGPFVGVSAIVTRGGAVLVGLRRGAHGAGTWAFPGGKVDAGEPPRDTVRRELLEETGLTARTVEPVAWTSDVFDDGGLHFVTLHHLVAADGEPAVLEPDKVTEWRWCDWDDLPAPLFAPAASLIATGWRPV